MPNFLMKDVEAQLAADSDGTYKKQLMEVLKGYKDQLDSSKQKLLKPEEHNVVEHLDRAVDAALSVISKCGPVPG